MLSVSGRLLFGALAAIAAALAIAMAFLVSDALRLAGSGSLTGLSQVPIPLESAPSAAKSSVAEAAKPGVFSIGSPPEAGAGQAFRWQDDAELRALALAKFAAMRNWDAAIYLASLSKDGGVSEDEMSRLLSSSCSEHLAKALRAEEKGMLVAGMQNRDMASLGMAASLALASNLRMRLRSDSLPPKIADIMVKALTESSVKDLFVRRLLVSMMNSEPEDAPCDYGPGAIALFASAVKADPSNAGLYMRTRLDGFLSAAGGSGDAGRRWLASLGGTPEQRRAFDALRRKRRPLEISEWKSLSKPLRWAVAVRAWGGLDEGEREALASAFSESLQGTAWKQELEEGGDEADAKTISWLRSCPAWVDSLNVLDYDGAWRGFAEAHRAFMDSPPGKGLEDRMRALLEVERSLWRELVSAEDWRSALSKEGFAPGKPVDVKSFMRALSNALPEHSRRFSKDTALAAACMINRGSDPRYVHIDLNASINDLAKHIPEKEFSK